MTAIEFAPELTAYSELPSGESVTADVAAPVYRRPWKHALGRPRVDFRNDMVLRVDDSDLVGVVLCNKQPGRDG